MPTIYGYTDIQGSLLVNGGVTASQLKLTSGAQNGYILQSDASGNATWIAATSGSANFANTNLTFTGNREHSTNNYNLEIRTGATLYEKGWLVVGDSSQIRPFSGVGYGTSYVYSDASDRTHIASNDINRLTVASSSLVINDNGDNYDVRIEGDTDTNLFSVNASRDNIGIGVSSGFMDSNPLIKLLISNSTATSSTNQGLMILPSGSSYSYGINIGIGSSLSSNLGDIGYASSITNTATSTNTYNFYGINSGISNTKYGSYLEVSGNGLSTTSYGSRIRVSGANSTQYGSHIQISGTYSTNNYGSLISIIGISGTNYGTDINITGSGLATTNYGSRVSVSGSDADYGFYSSVQGTYSTNKYGYYGTISGSNGSSTTNYGSLLFSNDGWKNHSLYSVVGSGLATVNADIAVFGRVSSVLTSSQSITYAGYFINSDDRFGSNSYGIYSQQSSNSTTGYAIDLNSTGSNTTSYGARISISGATTSYGVFITSQATTTASSYALVTDRGHTVFNESGFDYDFRIEGITNKDLFFVDASSDNIGIGTNTPNASAIVDITSTTKGFLPPRMTTTQRDAITPVAGLIIFNTSTLKHEGYNGSTWSSFY